MDIILPPTTHNMYQHAPSADCNKNIKTIVGVWNQQINLAAKISQSRV